MLAGCYLLSLPHLADPSESTGLFSLILTIAVYELLVLGIATWQLRANPAGREGYTLLLVVLVFLFDPTFAVNAAYAVYPAWGMIIAVSCLTLNLCKLWLLCRIAPGTFEGFIPFLVTLQCFLFLFQPLLFFTHLYAESFYPIVVYGLWLIPGAALILVRTDRSRMIPRPGHRFRNALILLPLVLVGIQLSGQSWVHHAPFHPNMLFPLTAILTVSAPRLFNFSPGRVAAVLPTALLLAANLVVPGRGTWTLGANVVDLEISLLRVNLGIAAIQFAMLSLRNRDTALFDIAFVCTIPVICGPALADVPGWLIHPTPLSSTLLLLAGIGWLVTRLHATSVHVTTLLALTALLSVTETQHLHMNVLRYYLLALPLILTYHRRPLFAVVSSAIILLLVATWSGLQEDLGSRTHAVLTAGILALLGHLSAKGWYWVCGIYFLSGSLLFFDPPLPGNGIEWGITIIFGAFAILGTAVALNARDLNRVDSS
jgi:hypothetical protein